MKKQYKSPAIMTFKMSPIVMNANSIDGNADMILHGEGQDGDVARGRRSKWFDDDDDY